MTTLVRPYGTWSSPVTARSLAGRLRLNDVRWDTDGETLVWLEGRGRQNTLVAQRGVDAPRDLTSDLSPRGGLGYGGGEFTVAHGQVYFVAAGRLYRQSLAGGEAVPLTPAFGALAAPAISADGHWLAYVHEYEGVDGLALVDASGQQWPRKLDFRADFAMQPVWHPGGARLAYVTWNFPAMPWDSTELRLLTLDYGVRGAPAVVAVDTIAGDAGTSVMQPEFSPDGHTLAYISDASGWWRIYLYDLTEGTHVCLTEDDAEFGVPAWVQGERTYGWTHDSRAIYTLRNDGGFFSLWRYDVRTRQGQRVAGLEEYTSLRQVAVSPTRDAVALIASSPFISERVISIEPDSPPIPLTLGGDTPSIQVPVPEPRGLMIHRRTSTENLLPAQLSRPQAITWTGGDGETVHGLYYPPASDTYTGIGLPPLIVWIHGGPTSQARAAFSANAQFFATRGFAVLEVNYRGSTGYGRPYRDKLFGAWGQIDVDDAASGAAALADRRLVDPSKRVIMGTSAGGYTVLQSLIARPGFYTAGICGYGISEHFAMVMDAEVKFESQYHYRLLGPLPETAALWRERSPVYHADRIVDPLLLFHGADDKVVPRAQSDGIAAALRRRGVPHEYVVFEGEGHGWRKPETIEAYYNTILSFLMRYVIYA